jgi:predicted Zn-dependent protease with MMP-like domain
MDRPAFEALVAEAFDQLPEEFLAHLENVDVVVYGLPSQYELAEVGLEGQDPRSLLGLYIGVPLTERTSSYGGVLPDRIALYQRSIESQAGPRPEDIRQAVRRTLIHEVAHHYGISDERLDEMGWG